MSAAASITCAPAAARFAPLPVRRNAPRATTVKAAAHSLSARRGVVELARAVPLATARVVRSVGRERQLRVVSVDDPDNPDMDNEPIMAGRPTALWRVLSCLPYLVPLMGSLAFGTEMYDSHPLTSILILVFQPLLQTYYSNSFTPFIVFFALFLVVVRSQKLPHFLRFNALQSMLLDISIMLSGLIIQYLPFEIQFSWLGQLANMLTFVTGTGAVLYSVFFTLQGKYGDIPTISEAVYIQLQR